MKYPNYRYYINISYNFKILGINYGLEIRFISDLYYFTYGYPDDLYENYRIREKYQMDNFIVQGIGQTLEEVSKKNDRLDKIFGYIEKIS